MLAWLIVLLLLAGYLVACRIWPYARCRRCGGNGRSPSPSGNAWRNCSRCQGSGRRRRLFAGKANP